MKKVIYVAFIFVLIAILSIACSDKLWLSFQNSISEERQNLFVGENDLVYSTFMSGLREEDYVLDGLSGNLVEFGVISFYVKNFNDMYLQNPSYALDIDGEIFEGELLRNPYDFTFVADIKKLITNDAKITVTLTSSKINTAFELVCVSKDWVINCEDAKELGYKALKSTLKVNSTSNQLSGEVYVKILYDTSKLNNEFFWCVTVIFENGKESSVVLDNATGKVLSGK